MSWEYNFLDHTADIAVDIKADTLDELLMIIHSQAKSIC